MGVVHKLVRTARTVSVESKMAAVNRRTPSPPVSSPSAGTSTPTASSTATSASKYPRFGRRGAPQAFPSKLYEILEGENPDIIGWTATGRGFEVRDHARLSSEVLGRFFKQDKFSSFQRQLNLYGFRKITKGGESGSYQHPHFRRGERTTLLTIRRSTKASPSRVVVPVSPASASGGTSPSSAHVSGNSSSSSSSTASNGNSSDINTNGSIKQVRSATPSPPPATVSRGVLPWPRPPTLSANSVILQQQQQHGTTGTREVSPDGMGTNSSGGRLSVDRQKQQQQQQRPWPAAPTEGGGGGSGMWGSHADPSNIMAGRAGEGVDGVAAEKSALDRQDAEVVSLLQRMATEAQDSPSRKRAAFAAQQWNGRHMHGGANSPSQEHLQQPRFQMPKIGGPGIAAVGPNESGQAQQTVFTEHLYDILSHERVGAAQQAGFYPAPHNADGRPTGGFVRQQQQQQYHQNDLSSQLATSSPAFSSSDDSSSHLSQAPRRTESFAASTLTNRDGADGGEEMAMSEQERQVLLARSRSGPANAAEQDGQILLARSRSGPADFTRVDEQHHYYHQRQSQQQRPHNHNAGLAFDHSPNRSPVGGRRGDYAPFDGARFGSRSSGVLPPLPSLNFEHYTGGDVNGGNGSVNSSTCSNGSTGNSMEVEKVHRAPWRGVESRYVN